VIDIRRNVSEKTKASRPRPNPRTTDRRDSSDSCMDCSTRRSCELGRAGTLAGTSHPALMHADLALQKALQGGLLVAGAWLRRSSIIMSR
jgi:hypothetical protein